MRNPGLLFACIAIAIASPIFTLAEDVSPVTPAEAAKKVNEKVVVENHYLNSEEDYKEIKNFTIFISKDHLDKFKKAGIESPSDHYKTKTIQVSGTVVLEKQKPWIKVTSPDQIKIVTKEKKSS